MIDSQYYVILLTYIDLVNFYLMHRFLYVITLLIFGISKLATQPHNFYLGATVGVGSLSAKMTNSTLNNAEFQKYLIDKNSINAKTAIGGIFAGYLFSFANFGIGSELFWQYSSAQSAMEEQYNDPISVADNAVSVQYKLTGQAGINLKAGYFLSENFIYALLGWQQYKVSYQANLANSNVLDVLFQHPKSSNSSVKAFSLGLGVQRPVNENYAIGVEVKLTKLSDRNYKIPFGDLYETTLSSRLRAIQIYSAALRFMYTF